MTPGPAVSVIVLAWGAEPYLGACVESVLNTIEPTDELVLVDNGARAAVDALPADDRLRIVRPESNLGFAGGCNAGVAAARGDTLVLLNSDAEVWPDAISRLVAAVSDPQVAIACGSVRLADRPQSVNTVGNPVHYLGVVWAGGYGEDAERHLQPRDVSSATGAFLAIRRAVWQELGGFPAEYFAYHEDTELSLRAWQRGYRVRYEPSAVAIHHYEFSRNPRKDFLLQRNRWLTVLTVYPSRLLALVMPMMIAFDLALAVVSLRQGTVRQWGRALGSVIGHAGLIRRRRSAVQAASVLGPAAFADLLVARIEPAMIERPPGLGVLNSVLAAYWRLVRALL
ncbi:glycosyltransferase family 2 protein [Jatrophihabitans sp.]|jgi:GT2 family glycosyltransferase|uniref:glycosyltransferase family 2 protein n=1 Tax=Jatrophihabitans sp. TaxID=1932789 RepID=UPI002EFFFF3F